MEQAGSLGKARLQEFVMLLAEKLYALEGQAVRMDYFATDEGHDLLVESL